MSQRDPFYLEARRVLLPAGSPPPLLRAASREALCWSKTSKNEASGPMGAKAMRADSNGKLQGQEAHRRPRRPCRVLQRTLPDSLSGDVGLFSQHFLTFYLGMRTLCPPPPHAHNVEWSAQVQRTHGVQPGPLPPEGQSDGPKGYRNDVFGILDPVFLEMDLWWFYLFPCLFLRG